MYRIVCDDVEIFNSSRMDELPVAEAKLSEQLNESGSLRFTLVSGHPQYGIPEVMSSYVTAYDDDGIIFYGRVLNAGRPTFSGQITYDCEGALSFLMDSEVTPSKDPRSMTVQEFFAWCINEHNTDIDNDPRRTFQVGNVTVSEREKSERFQITSYTQTKNAIENNLTGVYGGYLKIRYENGNRYIDWLDNYSDRLNPQAITIGENIIEKAFDDSGENLFTVIRPIGKNGLLLDNQTIDVFSSSMIEKYGRIIKSVNFSDAANKPTLQTKATEYVRRIKKSLLCSGSIQLVDMHYLDGSSPIIRLGDRFDNLQGFEGMEMTVSGMERDFMEPWRDDCEFGNDRSLADGTSTRSGSAISKASSRSGSSAGMQYKHIVEMGDLIEINAETLRMHGETLESHYITIIETASQYISLSERTEVVEGNVATITGSGVFRNEDILTSFAGSIRAIYDEHGNVKRLEFVDGTMVMDTVDGHIVTVGSVIENTERTTTEFRQLVQGSALWTQRDHITGVCGEFETYEDPETGKRRIVIVSGGGMKILEDNVEYGIYHEGNLNGGMVVDMLDDGTVHTQIRGDVIDLSTNGDFSSIVMTQSVIQTELHDATSNLYTLVEYTATNILREIGDVEQGLLVKIEENDQHIRYDLSAESSNLYNLVEYTATNIRREIGDVEQGLLVKIEENDQHIRYDLSAESSNLYNFIEFTATSINIDIANAICDVRTSIQVTDDKIETSVSEASSSLYTVIEQTATNIRQEVRRRAKVYVQLSDPKLQHKSELIDGDIWIKSTRIQSWNDFGSTTWTDASNLDWNNYAGAPQYYWDATNQRWEQIGDYGAIVEWGTRIEKTETNITLIAEALGAIDPTALASLDISADVITMAVSSAKSELYSVIKQTSTNIVREVTNNIDAVQNYAEDTASSFTQAIARKNRVFVQESDPQYGNTVIDGDIWIKTSGNNTFRPTWGELSAKTWASQNSTNWREYYEGYWYVRKNGSWERMNPQADVVEIGTKVELDEQHWAAVSRTVDENHIELGSRLNITAKEISSEVHAAKSTLYSVISQTATNILHKVVDENIGSYSTINQTATQIQIAVTNAKCELRSAINVEHNRISLVVGGTDANPTIKAASIVLGINAQTGSYTKISANTINLEGYVQATDITADFIKTKVEAVDRINARALYVTHGSTGTGTTNWENVKNSLYDVRITQSGNNYTLQKKTWLSDWVDVQTFSRATSLSGAWSSGTYTVTASPQGNSISISPYVRFVAHSSSNVTMNAFVATSSNQGITNRTTEKPVYLVRDGLTVKLKSANSTSSGDTYAYLTVPNATVTGSWSNGTFTATSDHGGSTSISPYVRFVAHSSSDVTMNAFVATASNQGEVNHTTAKPVYLVRDGLTVRLKSENSASSGTEYAHLTIPNSIVSGSWSSNTWTATSTHGGSASVTPYVQPVSSQGGAYVDCYVATGTSSSYSTHGSAKRLYLVKDGLTTRLKSENSISSGTVYGQVTNTLGFAWAGYSDNDKHYSVISGSGSNTNCSMQVDIQINGVSNVQSWGGPVTNAYRDGYSAGYTAGGGGASYSSRKMECTSVAAVYPGSSIKNYTFVLQGNYSYSAGSTYTFYKKN